MESKFYNNNIEENDGETDNYITCPLLQLKYSRPRKPITRYVNDMHLLDILYYTIRYLGLLYYCGEFTNLIQVPKF